MPEGLLCSVCGKPLDKEKDEHVVLNQQKVTIQTVLVYAHTKCWKKATGQPQRP